MTRFLTAILNWLREGYPEGIPPTDYLPALVLLPRIESVSADDLLNRDSAGVKAALAVSCQCAKPDRVKTARTSPTISGCRGNESFTSAGCPIPTNGGISL